MDQPDQLSGMDRRIEKKRWPPKKIAGLALAVLMVFGMGYDLLFRDSSSKLNVKTERITISTVTRGPFQEFIPVRGTVIPIQTIYLDAVEGGRVEKIYVEAGALVKRGDKILTLTNTNLLMDVMFREAELFEQSNNLRSTRLAMEQNRLSLRQQLAQIDFELHQQKRVYERYAELIKADLIAQQEYEEAQDRYEYLVKQKQLTIESIEQDSLFRSIQIDRLEASVRRMEANLSIVKQKLDNLTIRAPVTGQLTSLNAENIGESKSPGERLGQIDVLDGFKVRAGIDEHYIARIDPGLAGTFDFAGRTYHLLIKKVYPEVQDGRFEVDMEFDGPTPGGIRRGQTLQIRLALGDLSEAVLLPRGGFYQTTGGNWVYVLDPSGQLATRRQIRLGRQNPRMFEVLNGLVPGERVITSSYDSYGDMDKLILKSD